MVLVLLFTYLMTYVKAHSWLACTDYAEKNAAYYDHSKCRGWPRNAGRYAPIGGVFGGDTGFDTRPQSGTTPCASKRSSGDYANGHHSATYFAGQQVVLAHPMKNHGIGGCTNKYIPDNGNWIYYLSQTQVGEDDPVLSKFKEQELVNLGISPFGHQVPDSEVGQFPKPGFQNAPAFCEDTDKALGTYSFNVPEDMQPGEYTFVWLWAFNGPQDYYSTCFEVTVVADKAQREDNLKARGQNDLSLICDEGQTSTGNPGSLVGCDELPPPVIEEIKPIEENPPVTEEIKPIEETPPVTVDTKSKKQNISSAAVVISHQLSGTILLPNVASSVHWRTVHVVVSCAGPITANFWYNTDVTVSEESNEHHFDVEQTEEYQINGKKLLYSITWDPYVGCRLSAKNVKATVTDYSSVLNME